MSGIDEFISGVKKGLPVAVGYLPIAIAFGAVATGSHLSPHEAVLMSAFVFAGASQFMAASMILAGADALQIIIATFFINLRHLVMSMAVHHRMKKASTLWRAIVSFGITDETFALLTMGNDVEPTPLYAIGLMGIAYAGWVIGTAIGSFGAQIIPSSVGASMTVGLYAMFIGLLVPHARKSWQVTLIAVVSMVLNTVFSSFMSMGWSIVLSTILGATVGVILAK